MFRKDTCVTCRTLELNVAAETSTANPDRFARSEALVVPPKPL